MSPARLIRALALALSLFPLLAPPALAYRPFDGSDAGVAATRRFEVEFGPLGYLRVDNERFLIGPSLALTYGAGSGYDFGVEARRLILMNPEPEGTAPKIDDVEVTAAKVLRNGSIQDKTGVSVAVEGGLLMPTSDEHEFGARLSLFASHAWDDFALHLNGAVAKNRDQTNGRFAGLIAEGPGWWGVRPVGEAFLEREGESATLKSLLLGVIWQTRNGLALDFAIRTGYSDVHQVEFRSGITWNRHVAGPRI